MTKKDFIALAIRTHNAIADESHPAFTKSQLDTLANFCRAQNPAFKTDRWLDYIDGKCGQNGGKIEK